MLADVHGNLPALEAVLADATERGADALVVAGDLSGFGAHPDLVVDVLRERRAAMIRGNHEKDYVAVFDSAAMPPHWATSPRSAQLRWNMARLGPERRAWLASLPDRLELDGTTLVVHGSPRHVRDAVTTRADDDDLEAMFAGETCRLAFSGHAHRQAVRDLPSGRRLVNVGSVGLPLGGETRACYALAELGDEPRVELRQVPYDIEAAIAQHAELGREQPEYVELYARTLRTGRDYLAPAWRAAREVPEAEYVDALRRYLADNP